jgi:hypothetical protein
MTRHAHLDLVVRVSAAAYLVGNGLPRDEHMHDLARDFSARRYFEGQPQAVRCLLVRSVDSGKLWSRATQLGIDAYQAFRGQEALRGGEVGFDNLFHALDQLLEPEVDAGAKRPA